MVTANVDGTALTLADMTGQMLDWHWQEMERLDVVGNSRSFAMAADNVICWFPPNKDVEAIQAQEAGSLANKRYKALTGPKYVHRRVHYMVKSMDQKIVPTERNMVRRE